MYRFLRPKFVIVVMLALVSLVAMTGVAKADVPTIQFYSDPSFQLYAPEGGAPFWGLQSLGTFSCTGDYVPNSVTLEVTDLTANPQTTQYITNTNMSGGSFDTDYTWTPVSLITGHYYGVRARLDYTIMLSPPIDGSAYSSTVYIQH